MTDAYYYVAFIVDRTMRCGNVVTMEAGVDLLAGPFDTMRTALNVIPTVRNGRRRWAASELLASLLETDYGEKPARFEAVRVTRRMVEDYNRRHDAFVPWPPRPLSAKQLEIDEED